MPLSPRRIAAKPGAGNPLSATISYPNRGLSTRPAARGRSALRRQKAEGSEALGRARRSQLPWRFRLPSAQRQTICGQALYRAWKLRHGDDRRWPGIALLAVLAILTQQSLEIAATVENPDDDYRGFIDRERDRHPTTPSGCPQTKPQIVPHRSATRIVGQRADMIEDAIGEALCDVRGCGGRDSVVNGIEMVTRFRREDNRISHLQPRLAACS